MSATPSGGPKPPTRRLCGTRKPAPGGRRLRRSSQPSYQKKFCQPRRSSTCVTKSGISQGRSGLARGGVSTAAGAESARGTQDDEMKISVKNILDRGKSSLDNATSSHGIWVHPFKERRQVLRAKTGHSQRVADKVPATQTALQLSTAGLRSQNEALLVCATPARKKGCKQTCITELRIPLIVSELAWVVVSPKSTESYNCTR